ncbi:dual specificity phosphatase [Aphelenchoides avenae]|nr:dual specificity phosphatase [Aphelenchus avenae]
MFQKRQLTWPEMLHKYSKEITQLRPHLYLAGFDAVSVRKLRELGITHAIDASRLNNVLRVPEIEWLEVTLNDHEGENIAQYFERTTAFIETARQTGGKVLVFCAMGRSRSATLCIVYLMASELRRFREVYDDVKKLRPIIEPNRGFHRQMIEYDASLFTNELAQQAQ